MSIPKRILIFLSLVMSAIALLYGIGFFSPSTVANVTPNASLPSEKEVSSQLRGRELADQLVEYPYSEDLTPLIKRQVIRILVSPSRANFLITKGQLAGFEFELTQLYRNYLKSRVRKRSWPVAFVYIPTPFDQLLSRLNSGHGDLVAAGLTVNSDRLAIANFTSPYLKGVSEILVINKNAKNIKTENDLAGRTLLVMKGTSYFQSLQALNNRLEKRGLAPVTIRAEETGIITTEDILEMVNSGIIDLTVADAHLAELWAKVLPGIRIRNDIELKKDGDIAWAVRKDNPELLKSLNQFIKKNRQGTLIGNVLFNRYFKNHNWISNPLTNTEERKLRELRKLFIKYGEKYGFDWHFLAALGYQESRLNQDVVSPAGAVGIMQVLPKTAEYDAIGISNIDTPDGNIHAGTKYLAYLRNKFFDDADISDADRLKFILASYNAGPNRVKKLRAAAKKRGLNPNKWFSNVALEARRSIGMETVDYVANVAKYYVAYSLFSENTENRGTAIEAIKK